jgi:putative phage-type endonuclease
MTTTFITPESEEHWLSLRREDITSTEAAALFGMSPYLTAYELYHVKQGRMPNVFEENDRIQAGRHLEPAIASLVAERYGVVVEPFKTYARNEHRAGSSFDYRIVGVTSGTVDDNCLRTMFENYGVGILELKNVDSLAFKRTWQDDETPGHIEIQLQHQLELARHAWGAIVALVGGHTTQPYIRERQPDVGAAIMGAIRDFWRSVKSGEAPPVIYPDDAEVVIALHQHSDGSIHDAREDDDLADLLIEYDTLGKQAKEIDTRRDVIKATVLERVGDAGKILWAGGTVSLTQTKDSPGTLVTPDMVGTHVGGRSGYRMLRVYTKAQEGAKQ